MKVLSQKLLSQKISSDSCCIETFKEILGGFVEGLSTSTTDLSKRLRALYKAGYWKYYHGFYRKE